MLLSVIIILSCFIGVIFFIITEKLNRAVVSLLGAIVTYFVLIFLEGLDFSLIVDLLFSSEEEGFVNLHYLILIIGMMMIVQISHEVGTFQFIAGKLIKFSRGKPMNEENLKSYISFLLNSFGKNGLKWFNTLDIQTRNESFIFRGLHDMEEVYSDFFTRFYKYLLSEYFDLEFTTKIEEKTSNLIHLEFRLK